MKFYQIYQKEINFLKIKNCSESNFYCFYPSNNLFFTNVFDSFKVSNSGFLLSIKVTQLLNNYSNREIKLNSKYFLKVFKAVRQYTTFKENCHTLILYIDLFSQFVFE